MTPCEVNVMKFIFDHRERCSRIDFGIKFYSKNLTGMYQLAAWI
jgi:hypothetical protein